MAIKNRRGSYTQFNGGSNLEDGEFGIVMSGDPNTDDGTGTYISNGGGVVHRLLTDDDKTDLASDIADNASDISTLNATLTNINVGITRNNGSTVSVPTNTWTLLQSLALTQGTWMVIGGCSYSANTTGQRSVIVTASSTAPSSPRNGMRVAPNIGGITTNIWDMEFIVASPSATVYLWGVQSSGGDLNCFPYINAIRLR